VPDGGFLRRVSYANSAAAKYVLAGLRVAAHGDIPLDSRTQSVITTEMGRRLTIERDGAAVVSLQLSYWETHVVVQLVNEFRLRGAALATPWDPTR
jgi:hypothetical protein